MRGKRFDEIRDVCHQYYVRADTGVTALAPVPNLRPVESGTPTPEDADAVMMIDKMANLTS